MTNLHFRIVLRKDYLKKSGAYPACLRITSGRYPKLFPLGFDVKEKDFDTAKSQVKKSDPFHFQKNQLILKAETKARNIIFDYALNDKTLLLDEFSRAYTNDNYGSVSFYEYIDYLIEKRDSELSPDTISHYKKNLSKLKRFRPMVTFSEVNEEFVSSYRDYMIRILKNKEITWNKSLEFIKRIWNQAYKEGKVKENPFKNLIIKRLKGTYEHLTVEELFSLDKLYQEQTLPSNLQNVLRYFLFACYSGLRYRDIYELRFVNLKKQGNIQFIEFVQHKTNKNTMIPLFEQAIKLIPIKELDQQKVFNVHTNQDTNRKIKTIMEDMKIEKRITFHSARHTCSNVLYTLNVPLDVRCMIIGDSKEVITAHYTKDNLTVTSKAMDKFRDVLNLCKNNPKHKN